MNTFWGLRLPVMLLGAFLAMTAAQSRAAEPTKSFNIAAGDLGSALREFGRQSNQQILFSTDVVTGRSTAGVKGTLEPRAALQRILEGTQLAYSRSADGSLLIARADAKGASAQSDPPIAPTGAATSQARSRKENDAGGGGLEEIIVTAQKRSENVQTVPMSIKVLSAQALVDNQVDSAVDLSRVAPGFAISQAGGPTATISIRGIGTSSNGFALEPSVATVVDGVVMARTGSSIYNDFDDVDHLEVLRGPQGTLFGKNASAGALNIVTKDPTAETTANLAASYGSYNDVMTEGALSGSLVADKLEGRISFLTDNRDGILHDALTGRDDVGNYNHEVAVRGKLLFLPWEGTHIKLSADYADQHTELRTPILKLTPGSPLSEQGGLPEFPGFPPGVVGSQSNEIYGSRGPGYYHNIASGVSLQWDQDIGDFTLTSITAYRSWRVNLDLATNYNDTPAIAAYQFHGLVRQHQASEELRIASPKGGLFDYVAGVFFYQDGISNNENWVFDLRALAGPGYPILPTNYTNVNDTLNYAAFGEANIHVTDRLTLIAGVRETHERADFDLYGNYLAVPLGAKDSVTVNNFSWRGGARWTMGSESMLYATVARGFKGPGFNSNSTLLGESQRVNPEISTSYELGWKAQFLNDRLRTNVAAFYTTLDHFQVQGFLDLNGIPTQFLVNAGQMRSEGVEFEAQAHPLNGLSLDLNAAYIDAIFSDFRNAPCYTGQTAAQGCVGGFQNMDGDVTPSTPKFAFNISSKYDILLPSVPFDAFVRANYSWQAKVQWDFTNDPNGIQASYGLLGAGLGVTSKDRRYTLTASGSNLTNRFHAASYGAGITPTQYLLPDYRRIWNIRFDYKL